MSLLEIPVSLLETPRLPGDLSWSLLGVFNQFIQSLRLASLARLAALARGCPYLIRLDQRGYQIRLDLGGASGAKRREAVGGRGDTIKTRCPSKK